MKIAIICPYGLPVPAIKGGAIETLVNLIIDKNEEKKRLIIDVFTTFDKEAIDISKKYNNSKFVFLCKNAKYVKLKNKLISLLRKIFNVDISYTYNQEVVKYLKKNNYDRIIVEGDSSLIDSIVKVVDKNKIFFHIHHDPCNVNYKSFSNQLSNCNKVIAVSNYIKDRLAFFICDNPSKVEILYNCIDTKNFNKNILKDDLKRNRNKYGIKESDLVIMFVGRPIPEKGVKELLLAFKEAVKNNRNLKLLIVGNSGFGNQITTDYDNELYNISNDIKEYVIFTGFIHNNLLPKIHSIADIAVVPSKCNEAAGLVVVEAMASGLPLITTNSGGIPEYTNEECAIIIERDENLQKNILNSINNLINNKKLRSEMSKKAQVYSKRFNNEIYYNEFIKILENNK